MVAAGPACRWLVASWWDGGRRSGLQVVGCKLVGWWPQVRLVVKNTGGVIAHMLAVAAQARLAPPGGEGTMAQR